MMSFDIDFTGLFYNSPPFLVWMLLLSKLPLNVALVIEARILNFILFLTA